MKKFVFGLLVISSFMMVMSCSDDFVSDTTVSNSGLEIASEVKSLQVTNDFLKSLKSSIDSRSSFSFEIYPDYYGGYYIGFDRKPVFLVVKGLENIAKLDIKKRVNSDYFSIESCSYSYNQLNAIRKVLREKFGDERQEAMIDELGWVGQYIDQQENCIYVMLERCLDSDIAEFKRKVCDSPLIKFKVDSVVVLPNKEEIKKETKSTFGVTELSPGGFINNQNWGDGSAGYRVKYDGVEGFVTAGHVAYASGKEIGFVSGGPRIGLCEYCIIGGSQMVDAAFVSFYSPYKMTTNTAYKKNPLSDDIVILGKNDYVQKEGGTTFWSAGTVTEVGVDKRFAMPDGSFEYNIQNLTVATYKSDTGDSGGIVYSQYLGEIAGIHIAGNGADIHYFLPAGDVNAALGVDMY